MESCDKSDMELEHAATEDSSRALVFKQDCINNVQEQSSTNPIASNDTTVSCENTLLDALPVNTTVIASLDNLSQNFNDCTSIEEDNQESFCASMTEEKRQTDAAPAKEDTSVTKDCAKDLKMNTSLSQLLDYGLSDTEDSDSDSEDSLSDSNTSDNENSTKPNVEADKLVLKNTEFRDNDSSSDSSNSSEYDSDSSSSFSDIGACGVTPAPEKKRVPEKMSAPRTKGELSLDDLPPIEELKISVAENECIEIGVVSSIIDQLVIVQSTPGTAAYDIDTLFFLDRGTRPLGRVFDVLGPVTEPIYAVRFNSYEQAIETGVKPGTPVYCAPHTPHTSYVFVSELMKIKGSDASWEHNNEPPEPFMDYSDDEEERKARRMLRKKPQQPAAEGEPQAQGSNSLERNKKFVKQMNDKNLLMNERFKGQQAAARRRKPENTRGPAPPQPQPQPPVPHPWMAAAPPAARPEFWSAPPYQFAAYPPYGPLPVFPSLGPRQHFGPPLLGPAPPPPFNPAIPPPLMRPQPVPYYPNPRHPRWLVPGLVLQPPRGNFGNGSYTQ